eukprot:417786_1
MTSTLPQKQNVFNTDIADELIRIKLKEKEIQLLRKRLKLCDNVIISSISSFTRENRETFDKHKHKVHIYVERMSEENYATYYETQHHITNHNSIIIKNCIKFIEKQLKKWSEQKLNTPRNVATLDEHCQVAENNWNIHKTDMISQYLKTSISPVINAFTRTAANQFFCGQFFDLQHAYAHYLQALIWKEMARNAVFQFQYPKVKSGHGCLEQKINSNNHLAVNRTIKANQTHEICKRKFQASLLALHYEVDNYGSGTQNNDIKIGVGSCNNTTLTMVKKPTMYTNHHETNYTVKAFRNNPLGRKQF